MYHINKLNQVLFKKNLSPTRFYPKNLQTDYSGAIDGYIAQLTNSQKKIAYYILQFRNRPWIVLKNETISLDLGCSTKTVTRATNKFLKDGFITKSQQNKYAPNNYALNQDIKKVKFSFSHWFQSLSQTNQNLHISHGIRIDHKKRIIYSLGNVPQIRSSLILDSLFSKSVVLTRARAPRETYTQDKNIQKKGRKVNSEQKQLILDNRHDPRVKEMLDSPEIMAHIITPPIEKIAKLLTLDEKERFKLTAFTDETLEYVCAEVEAAITHSKKRTIINRMEWLVSFAVKHCTENNIKPDWQWYYDLCDIVGIDTKTEKKSFVMPQIKKKGGIYKGNQSSKLIKSSLTYEQQREFLQKEIENCRIKLSDPKKHLKFFIEESIIYIEKQLHQFLNDLTELDNDNAIALS